MPQYNRLAPPQALYPGDIFYSFGSAAYPGPSNPSGQVPFSPNADLPVETKELLSTLPTPAYGQRCACSESAAGAESDSDGRAITWEVRFDIAPSGAGFSLQGALRDSDEEYTTIESISFTGTQAVLYKTSLSVKYLFLRISMDSLTAGSATKVLAKILG